MMYYKFKIHRMLYLRLVNGGVIILAKEQFVLNTRTKILHTKECCQANRISEINRRDFFSVLEAKRFSNNDIHYCSKCNPNLTDKEIK